MAMVSSSIVKEKYWFGNGRSLSSRSLAIKASYVLLHQLDLILTVVAVSLGYSELNPLMRALLSAPIPLIVIKVFIPLVIAWLAPSKLLLPAVAFLALVAGWNIKEIILLSL